MDPDRWLKLSVPVHAPELVPELVEVLVGLGGSAVQEEEDRLTTWVRPPADADAWLASATARLEAVAPGAGRGARWRWEPAQDWSRAWRRGLEPRRVGQRFLVTPSWIRPDAGSRDLVIVIHPGMAFGTAEHATTRASLRLTERAVRAGDRVLDVGTGSGILAIAAARLGAARVLAVEVDADALDGATEHLRRNHVRNVVRLVHATVDAAFLAGHAGAFDVILANVLSGVLRPLLVPFRSALAPGGRLVLGGILTVESGSMREAALAAGFRILAEDVEDEWWAALLQSG